MVTGFPESARSEVRRLRAYVAAPRRVARPINRADLTSASALGRGSEFGADEQRPLTHCRQRWAPTLAATETTLIPAVCAAQQVKPMSAVAQRLRVGPTGASGWVRRIALGCSGPKSARRCSEIAYL